jgi:hypothetical protein
MAYDPWDWTSQQAPVAPLGASIAPSQEQMQAQQGGGEQGPTFTQQVGGALAGKAAEEFDKGIAAREAAKSLPTASGPLAAQVAQPAGMNGGTGLTLGTSAPGLSLGGDTAGLIGGGAGTAAEMGAEGLTATAGAATAGAGSMLGPLGAGVEGVLQGDYGKAAGSAAGAAAGNAILPVIGGVIGGKLGGMLGSSVGKGGK